MTTWKKVAPELTALFDSCLPHGLGVERRQMFGCPAALVNGNMFACTHETRLVVRLPAAERERLVREPGAGPFVVLGRTMREYAAIENPLERSPEELTAWIASALAHASGMPPKSPKPRGQKPRAKRR